MGPNPTITFQKATFCSKDVDMFVSLQNLVADPVTYKMGFVTTAGAYARFEKGSIYFIFENGILVGTVEYEMRKTNCGYINAIAVHPAHRGKNIARRALWMLLEDDLRNTKEVNLITHIENLPALNVYISIGFIIQGTIGCYHELRLTDW